ncbi:SulP family inorganic anion transporter [Marinobacter sp. ANT_B65]|uniref:SulP family inorganic anion transporter n=1 Tax=Marinobacter sp. ANT_B65 TaxID=2039467 RepID=UPI000BBEC45C|nr:sulfate permease [Marinobacter sp. ANT_B65]PCM44638.1 sodium-independent anion transporter [Marinobacter sp. ANT_B65]
MLYKLLPGLLWLQGYTTHTLRQDVISGLAIGVMLIPQSMGYAVLAGLPPEFGLYASIFPPLLYALLGTSNKISVGPVALDAILILSGLSVLAEPGSDQYLQLAIELTLLVGLIQFLFGLLRFGFIVNFLSYPVVVGYTSAAAIIIIGSQLQNLTGFHIDSANVLDLCWQLLTNISHWHPITVGIAVASLLFIFFCKRHLPKFPNALMLLVGTMLLSGLFHAGQAGVEVINSVPKGFPALQIPDISFAKLGELLPVAFTVAFMGFVGTMSICKSQESPQDRHSVQPNQELVALGLANALGAMFRSFPVSASFSRSAALREAGALTQVSAIVSSGLIGVTVVFLTPLFTDYPLPKAVLAAIIVMSVLGLFKYKEMKALFQQDRKEFGILMVTFLITLLLGVQQGLLVGVAVSLLLVIYNSTTPHITELGKIDGEDLYRNIHRFESVSVRKDLLIFRFDAPLYFANKDYFKSRLYNMIKQRPEGSLKAVILDAQAVSSIDSTSLIMLESVIENLQGQGIQFYLVSLIGPVRDTLTHSAALREYLLNEHMFPQITDAVLYIDQGISSRASIARQSNAAKTRRRQK